MRRAPVEAEGLGRPDVSWISQCLALDSLGDDGDVGDGDRAPSWLSPGVTNPFTRHPVVTANAAASLQVTTRRACDPRHRARRFRRALALSGGMRRSARARFEPRPRRPGQGPCCAGTAFPFQKDAGRERRSTRWAVGARPRAHQFALASARASQGAARGVAANRPPGDRDGGAPLPSAFPLQRSGAHPERIEWAIGLARQGPPSAGGVVRPRGSPMAPS